ncbi:type III secretion system export apparatus subunit SctT [Bradyrhizobium sp. Tv2a-2]|uniref:type III secretion system export apparatus subunit SctT n=1 Tax=Bradyrhizobium sp. Tv2a-2 TaxID=113395 RepID=UPI00042059A1|nr:type III secretion system export apparatus subunit SctT [Bradyrhizobium sp. Tv2a-2]
MNVSPHDILTQVNPLLYVAQQWLIAYAILLARPMAMLAVNPIFTRMEISNLLKGAIATGLIFPMWPMTVSALSSNPPGTLAFALIAIKESLVGTALGLPLGLPFWALLAAGDIIDQQRGATQGRLNDPAGFGDMSVTGMLFLFCGITILITTGRLDMIADALYSSWRIWRPLEMMPAPNPQAASLALHLLDDLQAQGLILAVPILLGMLLSDVMMMLLTRMASQLRVDSLSLGVRNIVFFFFLPLYASFLLIYAANVEGQLEHSLQVLSTALLPSSSGPTP